MSKDSRTKVLVFSHSAFGKYMKTRELKQKSNEELKNALEEKRRQIGELKFLLRQGKKVKNVKEVRESRKDIARILTLLN